MPNEEMGSRIVPEPPSVATGIVIAATAGFLTFVALSMAGLFIYLRSAAPGAVTRAVEQRFPAPALQKNPQEDLKRYEREQRAALSTYGWVDRSKGLARIPIEEAMRIIAAKGEHAYDPPDQPASAPRPADTVGARP